MTSREIINIDRRTNHKRRSHSDRRNLVRFESLGSDRRMGLCRRQEEFFVKEYKDLSDRYFS